MNLKEATDQLVRVCKESDAKKIIGLERRLEEAKTKIKKLEDLNNGFLITKFKLEQCEKINNMLRIKLNENM
jgi:hypothetical protein